MHIKHKFCFLNLKQTLDKQSMYNITMSTYNIPSLSVDPEQPGEPLVELELEWLVIE